MRFLHFDRTGESIGDGQFHEVTSATLTQGTDGTSTLTISTGSDVSQGDLIAYRDKLGLWREHSVDSVETIHDETGTRREVIANTILKELALKGIVSYSRTSAPLGMLHECLDGTRFSPGIVESNGVATLTLELTHTNALDMLQRIANGFGLEIETSCTLDEDRTHITGRTVSLRAKVGDTNGRRLTWGSDITGVRVCSGERRPITRLYVYGKKETVQDGAGQTQAGIETVNDGKPYIDVDDPALLASYGRPGPDGSMLPADGFAEFQDVSDPNELLSLGRRRLAELCVPDVTYEIDAMQLEKAGEGLRGIGLGDTVQVVDTCFTPPLRLEARVVKIEEDMLDTAAASTLTFGSIRDTLTQSSDRVESTVQQLMGNSSAWNDAAGLSEGFVSNVIRQVNNVLNATGGYTYLMPGEGILVLDRPIDQNPTMAIQLGGGYFRIADSKKSDGTWDWRTMGTGSGLVADLIVAGVIRGGANEWNLETGELSFRDGVIRSMDGRSVWDLTNSTFRTTDMKATNIDASGQITSTSGGTSAAIKGGTMTYENSYGGSFRISNDRMGSGSSWVNLVASGADNLVFHNDSTDYDAAVYVMCGPGYADSAKLSLRYGQFASIEVDNDNHLLVSDGGVQTDSDNYLTLQCESLTSREKTLDFGQGTSSSSDIYIGMPRSSYRPCLKINSNSAQLSCNELNRVDLASSYAALVHDDYHVIVDANGVGQTTRAASAAGRQATLLEREFERLADEGVDLSDPSGYSVQPAAIDEIRLVQVHDILRLLVDGDTEGAKSMLDQAESEQRVWTQAELDAFDATGRSDHPTGMADRDREAYRVMTAPYEGKENGDE